jgi:predicted MFS family arabinose efflux permease
MASDRWGRKPIIYFGLAIFAAGSVVAGLAQSIEMVTLGRLLQGAGAVSSAVAALLADVTRDQVRTTAMAILGAGMGIAFILAMVLGPLVAGWIGVSGIFHVTAALALPAVPVVAFAVPTPERAVSRAGGFRACFADPELLRLDLGIFLLHALLTGLFVTAPLAILGTLGLENEEHWKVYLPVLVLAMVPVFPLIRSAELSGRGRLIFQGAIATLAASMLLAAFEYRQAWGLILALLLFFAAFNYLEGALPSLISRRAPAASKGAALGVYATAQFLGGFAGATLGGYSQSHWGIGGAFAACAALPLLWLLLSGLRTPARAAPLNSSA